MTLPWPLPGVAFIVLPYCLHNLPWSYAWAWTGGSRWCNSSLSETSDCSDESQPGLSGATCRPGFAVLGFWYGFVWIFRCQFPAFLLSLPLNDLPSDWGNWWFFSPVNTVSYMRTYPVFLGGIWEPACRLEKKYWEPVSRFPISFIGLKNYALHRSLGGAYFYLPFLDNSLNHMIFFKPFLSWWC